MRQRLAKRRRLSATWIGESRRATSVTAAIAAAAKNCARNEEVRGQRQIYRHRQRGERPDPPCAEQHGRGPDTACSNRAEERDHEQGRE